MHVCTLWSLHSTSSKRKLWTGSCLVEEPQLEGIQNDTTVLENPKTSIEIFENVISRIPIFKPS
jgi:hypothetical protein